MEWDSSLLLDIKTIDDQHQNIIKAINALDNALRQGTADAIMSKLFVALKEYARKHFAYEERLLEKNDYPLLDSQLEQHSRYIDQIELLEIEYFQVEIKSDIEFKLFDYLNKWIIEHIQISDRQYVDFLHKKGIH